jgi:hypothetical protein
MGSQRELVGLRCVGGRHDDNGCQSANGAAAARARLAHRVRGKCGVSTTEPVILAVQFRIRQHRRALLMLIARCRRRCGSRRLPRSCEQCACANGLARVASLGFAIYLVVTLAVGIGTIAAVSDKIFAVRRNVSAACPDCRRELKRFQLQRGTLLAHCLAGTIGSDLAAAW